MKKAAVAVAHRFLAIIHRVLSEGSEYLELGRELLCYEKFSTHSKEADWTS